MIYGFITEKGTLGSVVGQGVGDRKVTGSIPTVADFRRKKNRLRNIRRENSECLLDSRSSGQHSLE